jgi:predicted transcriptional regulator of viral defense system
MTQQTRFAQKQLEITAFFEKLRSRIFTFSNLSELFESHRDQWNLPRSMGVKKFLNTLLEKTKMQVVKMKFPSYQIVRYAWGAKPSLYTLAATIHEKAYFSHLSAMYLHGLTDQIPKEIFINVEQKERPQDKMILTQEGIDKAFKNRSRVTTNLATVEGYTINFLNGKQTANLGVIKKEIEGIGTVSLTNIERTLIDIAVRPVYSGGVTEVINAYKASRGLVSIEMLVKYLLKIDHKYPYHQSIGFYLEKAGFAEEATSILDRIKKEFTFYLDYRINNPKLSQKWNLLYPDIFD